MSRFHRTYQKQFYERKNHVTRSSHSLENDVEELACFLKSFIFHDVRMLDRSNQFVLSASYRIGKVTHVQVLQQVDLRLFMEQSASVTLESIFETHHDLSYLTLWYVAELYLFNRNCFPGSPVESTCSEREIEWQRPRALNTYGILGRRHLCPMNHPIASKTRYEHGHALRLCCTHVCIEQFV